MLQSSLTLKEEALLKLETNGNVLPPEGTAGKLILRPADGADGLSPEAAIAADERFAPLPAFAPAPQPVPSSRLVPASARQPLPPAGVRDSPRRLPCEGLQRLRLRPEADPPATETDLPPGPVLPTKP